MTLADQFGVAQSSMKALAYGSEAMWAATILPCSGRGFGLAWHPWRSPECSTTETAF